MLAAIGGIIKVVLFLIGLFRERDKAKAKKKAEIGKEIISAFEETDKDLRASRLNSVIGKINRV